MNASQNWLPPTVIHSSSFKEGRCNISMKRRENILYDYLAEIFWKKSLLFTMIFWKGCYHFGLEHLGVKLFQTRKECKYVSWHPYTCGVRECRFAIQSDSAGEPHHGVRDWRRRVKLSYWTQVTTYQNITLALVLRVQSYRKPHNWVCWYPEKKTLKLYKLRHEQQCSISYRIHSFTNHMAPWRSLPRSPADTLFDSPFFKPPTTLSIICPSNNTHFPKKLINSFKI